MKNKLIHTIVVGLCLSASALTSFSREVRIGSHSATLDKDDDPSTREITFSLPKPTPGTNWKLKMDTRSASGNVYASVSGETNEGEEISLSSMLGENKYRDTSEDELTSSHLKAVRGKITVEIRPFHAEGRGPWDGAVSIRAVEE